jgi:hypothetical protein
VAIRFRLSLLWRSGFGPPLRWGGEEDGIGVEVERRITCSPWRARMGGTNGRGGWGRGRESPVRGL